MPYRVFPDASNGPLSLGPGQISAPIGFPETAGGTPPAVYLRIIMLGTGCGPPDAPSPSPTFQLRAGAGNLNDLPEGHAVFIRDRPEAASAPVARAQLFVESDHVYAIRVLIDRPGNTWQLRITNNDDAERKFTWVVADNLPESAQPWLNLPQTLRFNGFNGEVGRRVPQSVDVRNLGTGSLTISLGGLATGSTFQLDALPHDILPNDCGTLIITFNAPATVGSTEELYTAKSNDTQATESAHHNNRIRLIATTMALQPGWRWCRNCQCLAFTGWPGRCPGAATPGGPHDHTGSGRYSVPYESQPPQAQPDWRWCRNCQCLAFTGWPGRCPGAATPGGPHDHTGSGRYSVYYAP
jgi:hypothetical protein